MGYTMQKDFDDEALTLRDLGLLMEAHKNNIELTTSIAIQQKQIIDSLTKVVKSTDDNTESLKFFILEVKSKIESIENKMRELSNEIGRISEKIEDEAKLLFGDLKEVITNSSGEIKKYIYGSYVIMIGIIGTLIAIVDKIVR